jgi:hypothetical protein
MHPTFDYLRWVLLALSLCAYLYALLLPALLFQQHNALMGSHILAWGWWGLFMWQFSWLANPAFIIGVVMFLLKNSQYSKIASGAALGLGFTSYLAKEWWFTEANGTPITGFGSGYYVWLLSFALLMLACFIPLGTDVPMSPSPQN